jgi:hypothetical protein
MSEKKQYLCMVMAYTIVPCLLGLFGKDGFLASFTEAGIAILAFIAGGVGFFLIGKTIIAIEKWLD